MIESFSLFVTTETTASNKFEKIGNFLLKPARDVWNGSKICFLQMEDTSLEVHTRTFHELEKRVPILSCILLIITIVPGVIFKGLAFFSSKTRENHQKIICTFDSHKRIPEGVKIIGVQSYLNLKGEIHIDLRSCSKSDYEKIIIEKLTEIGPSVLWHNRLVSISTNEQRPDIDLFFAREDGVKVIDLLFQNFLKPNFKYKEHNQSGRVFDHFSVHGNFVSLAQQATNGQKFPRTR